MRRTKRTLAGEDPVDAADDGPGDDEDVAVRGRGERMKRERLAGAGAGDEHAVGQDRDRGFSAGLRDAPKRAPLAAAKTLFRYTTSASLAGRRDGFGFYSDPG